MDTIKSVCISLKILHACIKQIKGSWRAAVNKVVLGGVNLGWNGGVEGPRPSISLQLFMQASKELIYFYVSLSHFHLPQFLFPLQISTAIILSFWVCHIFSFPPFLILMWSLSNPGSSTIIIHQILISLCFLVPAPPTPPHAPSSSLYFIYSPNSFLLFISFLISFQRQREASKSGFVVIVTRGLAAFEEENSGARCGDDAYCHDNVVYIFFSISVEVCCVMSLFHLCLHQGIIQTDFICPQKAANHRCFGLCCDSSGVSFKGVYIEISHF